MFSDLSDLTEHYKISAHINIDGADMGMIYS